MIFLQYILKVFYGMRQKIEANENVFCNLEYILRNAASNSVSNGVLVIPRNGPRGVMSKSVGAKSPKAIRH